MQALVTTPGVRDTVHVATVPELDTERLGVRLRTLEVGVCGTDREISEGEFGVAPDGEQRLVLGHEFLGQVTESADGFKAGDLVTATVRRSCGLCVACEDSAPDECDTGRYTERGITRLHGFARDVVFEDPANLVLVPPPLGRFGVLAEPGSVCARAIRHAMHIGHRQVWRPQRALVIGTGAIGMLATYFLRLRGMDVVVASRGLPETARAQLAAASGAYYVSTQELSLTAVREEVGGFDLVVEAAGDAQVMLGVLGLLRRNGVGCLLGLDSRRQQVSIDGPVIGIDSILENRVLFGSVNAHHEDWQESVRLLGLIHERWPDALHQMIGLRVSPDRFAEAFAFRGVKATLTFE